ncbi:MAG: hypothetical protein EZS28_002643 [Streblomastix strix]|uniref:Uncharacterized protein n=1 Tax=Streblomastix strix TaxID=222440 RepID=A0A5J4X5B9_9EUKA|nr:MAG: hypothetical protein EZS28_002643 [Streblomastix strix]
MLMRFELPKCAGRVLDRPKLPMTDDTRSIGSIGVHFLQEQPENERLSQIYEKFFSIFFPLYSQAKRPSSMVPLVLWFVFCVQMVTLALFRIDNSTKQQSILSLIVNFVDFSSISLIVGNNKQRQKLMLLTPTGRPVIELDPEKRIIYEISQDQNNKQQLQQQDDNNILPSPHVAVDSNEESAESILQRADHIERDQQFSSDGIIGGEQEEMKMFDVANNEENKMVEVIKESSKLKLQIITIIIVTNLSALLAQVVSAVIFQIRVSPHFLVLLMQDIDEQRNVLNSIGF